jgi:hypothetical protein
LTAAVIDLVWEAVTCRRGFDQQREILALWVKRLGRDRALAGSSVVAAHQQTRGSVTYLSLVVADRMGRHRGVSVIIDRQFDRPVRSVVVL